MGYTIDEDTSTICLTRGDSFACSFEAYQEDGTLYELQEGDVVRFAVKADYDDAEPCIVKILDGYTLRLDPEDTEGLEFGVHRYDVYITFADGQRDTYIERKKFKILQEAHRR